MNTLRNMMFLLVGLMLIAAQSFASISVLEERLDPNPIQSERPRNALDETCYMQFTGFTTGTYSGSMMWPGGGGLYFMSGTTFTNSCTPGTPLYAYCIDLNHRLNGGQYCAEINDAIVNPAYPAQYPAMAYLMCNYAGTDAPTDRELQLAIWKLSSDMQTGSPTFGAPYFYINAGRGYPTFATPPVYPYVNTVYNTNDADNNAANAAILDALGVTDGIVKNVIVSGDSLLVAMGTPSARGTTIDVPINIRLARGLRSIAAGNIGVAGVKITIAASHGTLSLTSAYTNATGEVNLTLSEPAGTRQNVALTVCSSGLWPQTIVPCEGVNNQTLVVSGQTAGQRVEVCEHIFVPFDFFLPVELTSFSATVLDNSIALQWQTASEVSTASWEIERSISGQAHYSLLSVVPSTNNATGASYRNEDRTATPGVRYDYRLVDVGLNGERTVHNNNIQTAGLPEVQEALAVNYALDNNFPNPFNPETTIKFTLAETGAMSLKVYDIVGREVGVLAQGVMNAGVHTLTFKAGDLPSGTYFYKLTTDGFSATKKMMLMK